MWAYHNRLHLVDDHRIVILICRDRHHLVGHRNLFFLYLDHRDHDRDRILTLLHPIYIIWINKIIFRDKMDDPVFSIYIISE